MSPTVFRHAVSPAGKSLANFGAEGDGPSIYFTDPDGNLVELKGPPSTAARAQSRTLPEGKAVTSVPPNGSRRAMLARALAAAVLLCGPRNGRSTERSDTSFKADRRWFEAAAAMERLARSRGDQSYGAVLVADGAIIGDGPSRVVTLGDPTAHAEREAIRDAQRRMGRLDLSGSVLYSTSRPCRMCEVAAAEANVARMIHGTDLNDAGAPKR